MSIFRDEKGVSLPKHYLNWVEVANEFWREGMQDKHPLQRHREIFEGIAAYARSKASVIDYSTTLLSVECMNDARPDRKVWFALGRLHGRADMSTSKPAAMRPSPANIKIAFDWLYEEKAAAKSRRAKRAGKSSNK